MTCWFAYDMWSLNSEQLLWGYRPLGLFLSAWAFMVLAIIRWREWRTKKANNWYYTGLSTLSGFLLALGFPDPVAMPFVLLIAFVPLLLIEQEFSEKGQGWKVFRYAYNTLVLWNILSTYWVANSALAAGLIAITINALLMCIPFMLFHHTRKAMPRISYLAFIAYWITFEYGHLNWDLTWPWLTLGNGFAEFPSWIQWYEFTGVFGGTLWILGLNVLALKIVNQYLKTKNWQLGQLLLFIGLIVLPIGISMAWYHNYEESGPTVEAVLVQPNYEPHYEKFDIPEKLQVDRCLDLSQKAVTDQTRYLVFPETSFGYVETDNIYNYSSIQRLRSLFVDHPQLNIVTGLNAYHDLGPDEPHTKATRERQLGNGRTAYYEVYNLGAQIPPESEEVQIYKKSKLVPGPEIFPLSDVFFFLIPMVEKLGGTTAGLGIQEKRSVFSSTSGRVAPVICYESVFGQYFAGYVRQGAQLAFIMTNDGWWDNTAGHRQHLYFASLRAIETRRSIGRSANTGVSAFINQRGDILQPTKYNETTAIRGTLHLNDKITFYTRWGDMIARIALFLSIMLLLNNFVKRRLPKGSAKNNLPI
ncbi:MAG: apolipoprotein N-acyltransferase [Saprospiraceae bacterium]|nr:MAG: apolipoprotein N-acyltransferase [Saprospiraceae bacterium]